MADIRANAATKRADKEEAVKEKADAKEAKEARKVRGVARLAGERLRMQLEDEGDEENYSKRVPRDDDAESYDGGEDDAMEVDDVDEAPKTVSSSAPLRVNVELTRLFLTLSLSHPSSRSFPASRRIASRVMRSRKLSRARFKHSPNIALGNSMSLGTSDAVK